LAFAFKGADPGLQSDVIAHPGIFNMPPVKADTVMIIDDVEMTRTFLRMLIQSDAYNVVGLAASGKTGLLKAGDLRPDIICLDIHLPDEDGLQILTQLKEILPRSQVIMVTAIRDRDTVQTAISSGACGFIVKPFTASTIQVALEKASKALRATRPVVE
jgi:YesN/AraC family two-component response regulator